jgi:hypothetical protein
MWSKQVTNFKKYVIIIQVFIIEHLNFYFEIVIEKCS